MGEIPSKPERILLPENFRFFNIGERSSLAHTGDVLFTKLPPPQLLPISFFIVLNNPTDDNPLLYQDTIFGARSGIKANLFEGGVAVYPFENLPSAVQKNIAKYAFE